MAIVFVMEIVLVRHGQPEWLKDDQYNLDPGLTEKGTRQAFLSSSIFTKGEVDKTWVSPLLRAQQTLAPFKEAGVSEDIINGELDIFITYYETLTDAENALNPLVSSFNLKILLFMTGYRKCEIVKK